MTAVLGGLGAAVIWAAGSTFASRATRGLGPRLTLAWVMLVGLVALALILPWTGAPHLTPLAIVWLVLGGAGKLAGLLIMYHALRIGQLGVVMPIVTTEGGIAALIAILAGEPLSSSVALALVVTVFVMLTAIARRRPEHLQAPSSGAAASSQAPSPRRPGDGRRSVPASAGGSRAHRPRRPAGRRLGMRGGGLVRDQPVRHRPGIASPARGLGLSCRPG